MKKQCPSRTNGTLEHFKCARWNDLKKRCINTNSRINADNFYFRKKIQCKITKEEFYKFCDKNKELILNLFKNKEKPSINRINPSLHYSLDNIEIISLSKNCSLQKQKTYPIVAINLITKKKLFYRGIWIKEIIQAGFDPSTVQKICKRIKGKGFSHKGWYFHYADQSPHINLNIKPRQRKITFLKISQ